MEADRLKGVERRNRLADGITTREHRRALVAPRHRGDGASPPFASEPVDVGQAVCMALVHDIVEIDAGDTFAYDTSEAADTKRAREEAAADRLFGAAAAEHWAPTSANCGTSTRRGDTPEARYVMAVDRLAPMLLNLAEGGSAWREYGITRSRVIDRNGRHVEPALPQVWAAALGRLNEAAAAGAVDPA